MNKNALRSGAEGNELMLHPALLQNDVTESLTLSIFEFLGKGLQLTTDLWDSLGRRYSLFSARKQQMSRDECLGCAQGFHLASSPNVLLVH